MAESASHYVAREADLEALKAQWSAASSGDRRVVLLSAPLGGGKRALVGELGRLALEEDDDTLVWRVAITDEEDGLRTLLRIYGALFGALYRSIVFRGKVEMALNSQLPAQPKRVQEWYTSFIDAVKKGVPKPGETQFQVSLPRDNPLLALVEITVAIARKFPVLLDIENIHLCQSLAVHALVEALIAESKGTKLMLVLGTEPVNETSRSWYARPYTDMLDRRDADLVKIALSPWGEEETGRFLASKGYAGNAARLAEIAGGRPGFIAEVADFLRERGDLDSALEGVSLGSLADSTPDADELEEPDESEKGEGKRRHAGVEDAERLAYVAALLGVTFPSGLVADMGPWDRDSVDDLLDATEQLYKEVQFSQPLGTWVYQFKSALLRESVLARHTSDEDQEIARRVGLFIERALVPRGYEFIGKALRLFGEHAAPNRANLLRHAALSADQPQVWGMAQDLTRYFDEIAWPDIMIRTITMNLLDRLVNNGDVNQTESLYNQSMQWATKKDDKALQGWLLFAGSRLDFRRQDLYRSRDRANESLKVFRALDDKGRQAEVLTHLAMIELQDGNPNAALEHSKAAEALNDAPAIQAHGEYVRGLVAQRERKLPAAAEHFKKANEIAGGAGQAALALEAGFHYGEALLVGGQHTNAADVLARVATIARGLQNPVRERAANALLSQAHGALKNFEAALASANRALELTRGLKFEKLIAFDLYNVALFTLLMNKPTEAVTLFRQSRQASDPNDGNFQKELLYNMGMALLQIGERNGAEEALKSSLKHAEAAKDWRKVVAACEVLADLEKARGNTANARTMLDRALKAADKGELKDVRKGLRRKLDEVEG